MSQPPTCVVDEERKTDSNHVPTPETVLLQCGLRCGVSKSEVVGKGIVWYSVQSEASFKQPSLRSEGVLSRQLRTPPKQVQIEGDLS